ncbi:MAG: hypothetical protein ACI8RZ_005013 [Myxococcota bacterium]
MYSHRLSYVCGWTALSRFVALAVCGLTLSIGGRFTGAVVYWVPPNTAASASMSNPQDQPERPDAPSPDPAQATPGPDKQPPAAAPVEPEGPDEAPKSAGEQSAEEPPEGESSSSTQPDQPGSLAGFAFGDDWFAMASVLIGVVLFVVNMAAAWVVMFRVQGSISEGLNSGPALVPFELTLRSIQNTQSLGVIGIATAFALVSIGFSLFVMGAKGAFEVTASAAERGSLVLRATAPGLLCFVLGAVIVLQTLRIRAETDISVSDGVLQDLIELSGTQSAGAPLPDASTGKSTAEIAREGLEAAMAIQQEEEVPKLDAGSED